jgi:hypothetical protein
VKTSYGINQNLLNKNEKNSINLLHLKGMGMVIFSKLQRHGINNINDLSMLDDKALSNILHEDNLTRMRVYIKSAKNAADSIY